MKGKGKTKGENELPKDVLLGFVSVSREGFRITEKPKDSRSVSRVGFRRTEESRFVTSSGGLPKNENPKIRTFDRVGFRRTKTQRFVLSFGWASEERKPKDSFGWASEERKPKDSYFLSGGLPKNENPKIRTFVRVGFRRTKIHDRIGFRVPKNGKFQDSIGWASDLREKRNQDSLRVGFRPSGKEEPRFVSSGGLPKNDQRFIYTNT
ncbi:unnamed protein product [Rhizophagus irregularis]|nr:unnamed protein product [Rhizophagus irregularis]